MTASRRVPPVVSAAVMAAMAADAPTNPILIFDIRVLHGLRRDRAMVAVQHLQRRVPPRTRHDSVEMLVSVTMVARWLMPPSSVS